ncbi:MAG: Regulatory protein RepA [candidate division WS2 bacterium]|nr:Regulatory protein RepA [Candidatus Lithacetigena glycinireducens]
MTTLEYAQYYLSKGLSIIPLKERDKTPAIQSWKEYQTKKPTTDKLGEWFADNLANNVGVITGRISGIAVVDLDSPEAVRFARDNKLPPTPLVKTAKGYHCFYRYRDGIKNFQKRDDLPGIDLRGDGGYVVAPPSIHPTGKRYEWVEGKGLDDLPLAELPEIILARPENKTPLKKLYGGVEQGLRNDSLTRIIGSLVNDGLTFAECLEFAYLWNQKNNPPLPEKEIERTVGNIFKKHHSDTYIGELIDPLTFLKKGSDLLNLECSVEWLVDRLIPKQSITLLHGKGGIGKTWLALTLANAISKGIPFMGLETQKIPVVFMDFENSFPVLVERVKKIEASEVLFWHNSNEVRPPKLDRKEWEQYKRLPVGLLIFDTFRSSQLLDENDSKDMALIMSRLKELRDKGFTIILLHHTPKGNERTYRGSGSIFDLSDHVLSLHKVRKGNYEEIDDDEDTGDHCYWLGVKDKTRYKPFHIFLEFNPEKGFVIAPDPDTEDLEAICELLTEKGKLNQSQLFGLVKDQLGIRRKNKLTSLLRKGEGQLWRAVKEGRCVYYEPVSSVHPIYMRTSDTGSQLSSKDDTDNPPKDIEALDNSKFKPVSTEMIQIDTGDTDDEKELGGGREKKYLKTLEVIE